MNTLQKQAILPKLDHLTMNDYINVYEPSEDTYLLCDAIENDRSFIVNLAKSQGVSINPLTTDNVFKCTNNENVDIIVDKINNVDLDNHTTNKDAKAVDMDVNNGKFTVLEIGSGSGCVISFISLLLQNEGINFRSLATDINPFAVSATLRTAEENDVKVDARNSKFVDIFDGSLDANLDILIFNPPYVPTPDEEVNGTGIEVSWAGGEDGRIVIDLFLPYIKVNLLLLYIYNIILLFI
jgi:methylase of polypeptide subunit release factors